MRIISEESWHHRHDENGPTGIIYSGGIAIADAGINHLRDAFGLRGEDPDPEALAELVANADLLAAAPTLLKLLKLTRKHLSNVRIGMDNGEPATDLESWTPMILLFKDIRTYLDGLGL